MRTYLDQLLHVWILGWDAWATIHNPLGIFHANINYPAPYTLALSDHMLGLLPQWAVGYLLSRDYVAAHNYAYLINYIISGVGSYFYFRYSKAPTPTAFVGAIYFTFFFLSPDIIEQIQLSCFGYTFLVFLFLERFIRGGKRSDLVAMSVLFIIGFLSGFYLAYMLTMALCIYIFISFVGEKELLKPRKLGLILLSFLLSMTVLSPTIYPYMKLSEAHVIRPPRLEFLIQNSRHILYPDFFLRAGIVLLCSAYLLYRPREISRRIVLVFSVIAITFHILTLGPYLKIGPKVTGIPLPYKLFALLPGFTAIRYVWRFCLMAYVGEAFIFTATLSAIVHDKIYFRFNFRNMARISITILIVAPFLLRALRPRHADDIISPIPHSENLPEIYRELVSLKETGPVVEFPLFPTMKYGSYIYQYFSLFHHRRLFNGSSGYAVFGNRVMRNADLTPEGWVEYFRMLGVRLIVSHPPDFIARIIEKAARNMKWDLRPIPPPDERRPDSIIIINPVERAIYQNGIRTKKIALVLKKLGISHRSKVYPAAVGKDKFLIDLGHDRSRLLKSKVIPPLPEYASLNGNILSVAYRDLPRLSEELGEALHFILLKHRVDRIEVRGFRRFLEENIDNPFFGLTEAQAEKIGLEKVAAAESSVIWRIEQTPLPRLVEKPNITWNMKIARPRELNIEANLSVPVGAAWKNPNPFGVNRGEIKLRTPGKDGIYTTKTYLNIPLAITEQFKYVARRSMRVELQPGKHYNVTVDFPDLSSPVTFALKE